MNRPEFVFFDLGRVLLEFDHEIACQQMSEVAGVTVDDVRQQVFESGLELRYERGELSTDDFYDHFCRTTASQPDREQLLSAAGAIFTPNEPVMRIVAELQHQLPLGILSNTCEAHWDFATTAFPLLAAAFQTHVLSYQVQSLKPEPAIYQAAQAAAGVPPSSIFFVDDIADNVQGARQCGWDAVLYTSPNELRRELSNRSLVRPRHPER